MAAIFLSRSFGKLLAVSLVAAVAMPTGVAWAQRDGQEGRRGGGRQGDNNRPQMTAPQGGGRQSAPRAEVARPNNTNRTGTGRPDAAARTLDRAPQAPRTFANPNPARPAYAPPTSARPGRPAGLPGVDDKSRNEAQRSLMPPGNPATVNQPRRTFGPNLNPPNVQRPGAIQRDVARPDFNRPTARPGLGQPGSPRPNALPESRRNMVGPVVPGGGNRDLNRPQGARAGGHSPADLARPGNDSRRDRPDFNRDGLNREGVSRDGRRAGQDQGSFAGRNFRTPGDFNNVHRQFNVNRNQSIQQLTGRNNFGRDGYRGDYRRYGYAGGYYGGRNPGSRYGYQASYPWWAVMPRMGLAAAGYGYGYGFPHWGFGYNGWGGYGGWGMGNYGYSYPSYVYTYPTYSYQNAYAGVDLYPDASVTVVPPATVTTADTEPVLPNQAQSGQQFVELAKQAFREAQYQDAVRYAQHAMVDDPSNSTAVLLMAQALFAMGQYKDAAGVVQMAVQSLPADKWNDVVANRNQFYGGEETYAQQLGALEKAASETNSSDSAVHFLLGFQYSAANRLPDALRELDRALDLQPQDQGAQRLRDTVAVNAGVAARPHPPADTAPMPTEQSVPPSANLEAKLPDPTPEQRASSERFTAAGEEAFRGGQYAPAMLYWQHALIDDPNNGGVVMLMAQALFALQQYDAAAGAIQMAMQMVPQTEWGSVVQNYSELYPNIAEYTTQLKALERARTEQAENPALRFLLGFHFGYLGYPQQAVREFDKAIDIEPNDQGSWELRNRFATTANVPARTRPASLPQSVPGANPGQ